MTRALPLLGCAALIATSLTLTEVAPASAAPNGVFAAATTTNTHSADGVEPVQYRNRYHSRRYVNRHRNFGRNAGIGIGAAIIGGLLLSEAARAQHRHDHHDDWQRCADTYRSFEPRTGMYTGYDGERHTCPYLR